MPEHRSMTSKTPMSFASCLVASAAIAVAIWQEPVAAETCEQLAEAVRRNATSPGTLTRQLEETPDVNCRLPSGETPLLLAARAGDTAGVELLLARGADPNAGRNARESTFGRLIVNVETPLILAAARGNDAIVRALLTAGARPLLTWTGEGMSPSRLALERRHQQTYKILKTAEEAAYAPGASAYVEEDVALRRILYLAQNPRDVSSGLERNAFLLERIARDAAGMDRSWNGTVYTGDGSFLWTGNTIA